MIDYSVFLMTFITLITAQITTLDLAQFRFGRKKLMIILTLELILQVILNGALWLTFGLKYYARMYFLTMDIPAIITFWYVSKKRDSRDVFTILITIFLSFSISIPCMWISKPLENGYWWYDFLRIIIYSIALILIHIFIRKRYQQLQDVIEKGWAIYSILPFIGSAILYYKYLIYTQTGEFSDVMADCTVTVIILAAVFLVFDYIFTQLQEKYLVQEQKRILALQNKAQRDQFEQQKEAAEKTNRRWHDLRHNIQELIELLESGDSETALSYLKEQRGVDEFPREEYCLHKTVNSILCLWAAKAQKAGIRTEIKTDIPDQLTIDPMELSALFSNAFENAYEACLRLPEDAEKYIKVGAYYNGKRLAIGFNNTCPETVRFDKGIPVSSKNSGGIGTRSISYTVSRFHGTKYFDAKDGIFTARFVLNI